EEIYFGLVKAVRANDKTEFESFYSKKSQSNPSRDFSAPFVNDDFLLFSLIVGIEKFGLDRLWIKNIVSRRPRSDKTVTFENLLNENVYSTSNLPEIVISFLDLTNPSRITN